jgi:hypothetical protein
MTGAASMPAGHHPVVAATHPSIAQLGGTDVDLAVLHILVYPFRFRSRPIGAGLPFSRYLLYTILISLQVIYFRGFLPSVSCHWTSAIGKRGS